jgi:UDP-GlcNAc:undecaprenyl-phosphate/decaprenyl-phosphate GlcNAc-1-phosphate transferase
MQAMYNEILLSAFAGSAVVCGLIAFSKSIHVRFTSKAGADSAIQSAHDGTTPRIGGLGLILALGVAALWCESQVHSDFMGRLILSSLPLFAGGLLDDLGFDVKPVARLALAFTSAILMSALTGVWLTDLDISFVNSALAIVPIGLFFTAFATAGASNAFNIIDGLNGLASGTGIIVSGVIAIIALSVGDTEIAASAFAMLAALTGFFIWNFPRGKLFLGDCGAYFVGFFLSWLAVLVVERNDGVSPWAILVVFAYPITETVFTIVRRKLKRQSTLNAPDQDHMHSMVFKFWRASRFGGMSLVTRNSVSALLMLLPSIVCAFAGVKLSWSSGWSQVTYVGFFSVYTLVYLFLKRLEERTP